MDIDAFILIGGRSTRLGTDKAFADVRGEALASRAARIADGGLRPKRITFVTGDEGQFKPDLVFGLGRPVVADIKPGFGAWSGLHTALWYAQSEWIFVLACDLPFVSVELLQFLALLAINNSDAIVPQQPDERLQPLCALYRIEPTRKILDTIFTGSATMPPLNTIFDELKTRKVGFDEYNFLPNADRLFLNVNTAIDLKAALDDD